MEVTQLEEIALAELMEANDFCPIPGCDQAWMYFSTFSGVQRKVHFRAHIRTHAKIPPFVCTHEGCQKSYFHINSLGTHKKKEHSVPVDLVI
jgi:hypothetical protein